jgi:surface protein
MKKLLLLGLIISLLSCQPKVVKCQEDIKIGSFIEVGSNKYKVVDNTMLREMIINNEDLTYICTSKVTDMSNLRFPNEFNGDISKWDVSNVTNMEGMFLGTEFNGDISKWDVSNVTNMKSMFAYSKFNGDISKWDVSNVTDMGGMFSDSEFYGDISKWDNKPIISKSDCRKEVVDYLNRLNLSNILWLHDEGYVGGVCTGKPNQYCGRVEKFVNGKYWTYDIIVFVKPYYNGKCKVTGTWDNYR